MIDFSNRAEVKNFREEAERIQRKAAIMGTIYVSLMLFFTFVGMVAFYLAATN
jgi:hypothetical protein